MDNTLLGVGIACLVAAVVGGGLKAFGLEIPVLSSLRRQLALGLLGLMFLAVVLMRSSATKPSSSVPPARSLEGQVNPEPAAPKPQSGQISLSVNSDPRVVPPGGSTSINVLATAPDGTPVADALISVSTGGGVFETTGATKAVGRTDSRGVFSAVWRTNEASAYSGDMSYGFGVEATKDGMIPGKGEITVFVRK